MGINFASLWIQFLLLFCNSGGGNISERLQSPIVSPPCTVSNMILKQQRRGTRFLIFWLEMLLEPGWWLMSLMWHNLCLPNKDLTQREKKKRPRVVRVVTQKDSSYLWMIVKASSKILISALWFTYGSAKGPKQNLYLPIKLPELLGLLEYMVQITEQLAQQPRTVIEPLLSWTPHKTSSFSVHLKNEPK